MLQPGKIAVLMGGSSAEREVSLKSGQAALDALLRKGVDAFALDIQFESDASICRQLTEQPIDGAFIALHGRGGEDGLIQGVLESLGIPYSGSGVAASALAMDKLRTKLIWSGAGLPTPRFMRVKHLEDVDAVVNTLGFPVIVKPVHEGSSIGMSKAIDRDELAAALETAVEFDNEILVEQWIDGNEYTAAILDGEALPLIRLETPREFYDYQAKYISDDTCYHCPCGLDEEKEKAFQELVLQAFNWIGVEGWGRVDLMCDSDGKPWLIEINTIPGLTDHSLVPMAARQHGIEFDELIYQILMTMFNKKRQHE